MGEAAIDDLRSFREYLFRMVGAEAPASPPGAASAQSSQCPSTPSREALRKQLSESFNLDDSILIREELQKAELPHRAGPVNPELGTSRGDVRKAYLELAKHYHPDKGGDQDMFRAIHSAYEFVNRTESETSIGSLFGRIQPP